MLSKAGQKKRRWVAYVGVVTILTAITYYYYPRFERNVIKETIWGSGVHAMNAYGETRLHKAVRKNDLEQIKFLLEQGADVNLESKKITSSTPLAIAAKSGYFDVFKYLIEHGADVNIGDIDEMYPTHHVAAGKATDPRFFKLLYDHGCNILRYNTKLRRTALHFVAAGYGRSDKHYSKIEMIDYLLAMGADINERGRWGTPLHHAILGADLNAVKHLVEKGASLSLKNDKNRTPLEFAEYQLDLPKLHISGDLAVLNDSTEDLARQKEIVEFLKSQKPSN